MFMNIRIFNSIAAEGHDIGVFVAVTQKNDAIGFRLFVCGGKPSVTISNIIDDSFHSAKGCNIPIQTSHNGSICPVTNARSL